VLTTLTARQKFLLLVLAGFALLWLWVVVGVKFLDFPAANSPCGNPAFRQTSFGPYLLVACIASIVLGRVAAYLLFVNGQVVVPFDVDEQPPPEDSVRATVWVQWGLVIFLGAATLGLIYETAAVWSQKFWAITEFVRCGAYLGPWQTLIIASFICFLLSTWLWYPHSSWPPTNWLPLIVGVVAIVAIWFGFQFASERPAGDPPSPLPWTSKWGIVVAATAFLGLSGVLVWIDFLLARRRWKAVGNWAVAWTRHYPVWNFPFAAVFGAMIGHFFWK
jgi:hypothetical protein